MTVTERPDHEADERGVNAVPRSADATRSDRRPALLDAALAANRAGICVVRKKRGQKRPDEAWKRYQHHRPDEHQLYRLFAEGRADGFGVVCGGVSGNLEVLEFEGRAVDAGVVERFCLRLAEAGHPGLYDRIADGWSERSPSGGVHLHYRCQQIGGNTKLASRPATDEELVAEPGEKTKVLIETRGEGGFVVTAPSTGHPDGGTWKLLAGGPATLVTITPAERDALFAAARSLDEASPRPAPAPAGDPPDRTRPGDDYVGQTTWPELLEPDGWTLSYTDGDGVSHWCRPGKGPREGTSATTNYAGTDLLHVFSTSIRALEAERSYTRFQYYALTRHGGDFTAAARELRTQGYGTSEPRRDRPSLRANDPDLAGITETTWEALVAWNCPSRLFRHGDVAAMLERDDEGHLRLNPLNLERVVWVLARCADWYVPTQSGPVPTRPNREVGQQLLTTPDMPLPVVTRIVGAPVFAADGTLDITPGYHEASRTYFDAHDKLQLPPISSAPTNTEIADARRLIVDDLLGDFPFASDADRAHAVALLLQPFVREMIDGATPLHLVDKPSPGTGAGLLCDVTLRVSIGQPPGSIPQTRDDEELRKRLTALFLRGTSVAMFDNLSGVLDSAVLSSALTEPVWEDRILGVSKTTRVPIRLTWAATANNLKLTVDVIRRTVWIRLDAHEAQPWLRTGWRHENLRGWVAEHRGELVGAALTLVQAWVAAGRPHGTRTLGSYENWATVMGGILDVAGIGGFLENVDEFYETAVSEDDGSQWFVEAMWQRHEDRAFPTAEAWRVVDNADDCPIDLGTGNERSQRTRLGRWIGERRDRVFNLSDGNVVRLHLVGVNQGVKVWKLMPRPQMSAPERNDVIADDDAS